MKKANRIFALTLALLLAFQPAVSAFAEEAPAGAAAAGKAEAAAFVPAGAASPSEARQETELPAEASGSASPSNAAEGAALSGTIGSDYEITAGGKYYLSGDTEGNITIPAGVTASLDLNGYVLASAAEGESVIVNNGTLTVTDSEYNAAHSGSYASLPKGGVITGAAPSELSSGGLQGAGINNAGELYLYGGSVTGNHAGSSSAGGAGGGVYSSGSLTIGGTAVISGNCVRDARAQDIANNLYLPDGTALSIGTGENKPAVDMNISVTTQTAPTDGNPVVIASGAVSGNETHFSGDSDSEFVWFNSTGSVLELRFAAASITAEEGNTVKYGTVQAALDAAGSGQTVKLLSDCKENISVTTGYQVSGITLDLNGHVLTSASDQTILTVDGVTLNLTDSGSSAKHEGLPSGGLITGGSSGIFIAAGGVLNMRGGTVCGNGKTGSVVSAIKIESGSTLNMYDGAAVCNNVSGGNGAGISVDSESSFHMYGGSITGNTVKTSLFIYGLGGGVYSAGTFSMTGGIISGNTAKRSGGGVYNNGGKMTVGGTAVIRDNTLTAGTANNLYLKDETSLSIGTGAKTGSEDTEHNGTAVPEKGMRIGVTLAGGAGRFTENGTAADVRYFRSDSTDYMVAYQAGSGEGGYLELTAAPDVCEMDDTGYKSIAAALAVAGQTESVISLLMDVEEDVTVEAGQSITLDLKGHVLSGTGAGSVITDLGRLTVTSSNTELPHKFTQADPAVGFLEWDETDGTETIKGGVITGGRGTGESGTGENGAGIFADAYGTLRLEQVNIVGNDGCCGGGVSVNGADAAITDCVITGNKTSGNGGGVYFADGVSSEGSLTLGGKTAIRENSAGEADSNLFLKAGRTVSVGTGEAGNKVPVLNGAEIHVSTETVPTVGAPVQISSNGSAGDAQYFKSDNTAYTAAYNAGTGAGGYLELVIVHHHGSWEYSADGAVLTAACGNAGCTLTDGKVSITLQAEGKAYDKKTCAASLSDTAAWTAAGLSVPKISYYSGETTADPVKAGVYTARISAGDATAVKEFTISPKELTVSGTEVKDKIYDGTAAADAAAGSLTGSLSGDSVSIDQATGTFDDKNAGTNKTVTVQYTLKGTDAGNYAVKSDTASADITPKPISVKADNRGSRVGKALVTLTYTADPLCEGDSFSGFLITDADRDIPGEYDILQGTLDAGTNYTIQYTKGTYTVHQKEEQSLSFAETAVTKSYGDEKFTRAVSGAETAVTYTSSNPRAAEVNSATGEVTIRGAGITGITASAAEDSEYAAAEASYTLTVTGKKLARPGAEQAEFTYSGSIQGPAVTGFDGSTMTESGTKTAAGAGSYTLTYALKDQVNYCWADGSTGETVIHWSIGRAVYDLSGVSFEDQRTVYDGKPKFLAVSGELPEGVTVSYEGNGETAVGEYTVTARFSGDAANYEAIPDKTAKLTITAASSSMITYNGRVTEHWILDAKGWRYLLDDGTYASGGWYELENPYATGTQERKSWFHFGADDYMHTGWFTDQDEKKYYLHPVSDGTMGRMYHGKQIIGGKEYEFSETHDGAFGHLIGSGAEK